MMNALKLFVAVSVMCSVAIAQNKPDGTEWENHENLSLNKEPARATFTSFPTLKSALKILPETSPWRIMLDSEKDWKFHWCRKPAERPIDFYKPSFNVDQWETVKVPCSWQAMGIRTNGERFGVPIYVNQHYIFTPRYPANVGAWPKVTGHALPESFTMKSDDNPVGSYRRDFSLPKDWNGSAVFLQFDGVDSFFYLWVNGQYIGFSKNSRDPAIFDVTKYVKPGKNMVALEVYRNSDGSYLEAQDMFRLSGIFRSVSIYRVPKAHIRDFYVLTEPVTKDAFDGDWTVNVEVELKNCSTIAERRDIRAAVYTVEGKPVAISNARVLKLAPLAGGTMKGVLSFTVSKPALWSAECPNLYTLVLRQEQNGKILEFVSAQLGFRKVEIRGEGIDRTFLVNGQPVKLKGANRHETDPLYGHYVPRSRQEQDVKLLKQANCNHVRNSHYPQDAYFYYLCNKYGIYLEDEANIESHGYFYGKDSLSHPPSWKVAHIDRVMAMVERNKNQPSIVIWSLGNEAGPGDNFKAACEALKGRDTSRPVQYERNNSIVDMGSNQYPGVGWVWATAAGKSGAKYPFHISEYAHNMMNAMGNLKDYQDAIESSTRICGAAIWDWVDQGLYQINKEGKRIIAYGGDFGDQPTDSQFVMNGCILSDREPEPGYFEIKHVFQNISVTLDGDQVSVKNKHYFRDLSAWKAQWKLLENGKIVLNGALALPTVLPQQTVNVPLPEPVSTYTMKPGAEYALRVEFIQKKTESFWAKGWCIASDQFALVNPNTERPLMTGTADGSVKMVADAKTITFTTKNAMIVFDKMLGTLCKYVVNGKTLIDKPMRVDAFRCPSSNEVGLGGKWAANGLRIIDQTAQSFGTPTLTEAGAYVFKTSAVARGKTRESLQNFGGQNTRIVPNGTTTEESAHFVVNTQWTVFNDGSVACQSALLPRGSRIELARLGYNFELPVSLSKVEYYGFGPFENYPDRRSGAFPAVWENTVSGMVEHYGRPEDMGDRGETRWVALSDGDEAGFVVAALEKPFTFSAIPYTPTELVETMHPVELPDPSKTVLTLSTVVRGLGGASCGPGPLDRDIPRSKKPFLFGFVLRPYSSTNMTQVNLPPAELDLTMLSGMEMFTVVECSSAEPGEGNADHICDGDPDTMWHSQYGVTLGKYPHMIAFDLARVRTLKGIKCWGRQGGGTNGRVKQYAVEVSTDMKTWREVAKGNLKNTSDRQDVLFAKPQQARYIRFIALSEQHGQEFASMGEIGIIE